jgi:hypothetical protein
MRRVAQVGWAGLAAGLLVGLAGGAGWLTGLLPGPAARALCVAGLAAGLPAAAVALAAERRAATLRAAAKGVRGHLVVRDCVQDMAGGSGAGQPEATVRLVADLHLPGRSPSPHRLRGRLPAADAARLTRADRVPCAADPADPEPVWIFLPDEDGAPTRLAKLHRDDPVL